MSSSNPLSASTSSSSSAVAEKVALSYQRATKSTPKTLRKWGDYLFVGMRIPLPGGGGGGGGIANGPRRELTVPVLRFLHPSKRLPILGGGGGGGTRSTGKGKRTSSLSPTSPISSSAFDRGGGHSTLRAFLAIVGTILFVFFSISSTFKIGKRAIRAGRDSGKIPFVDPSTLILDQGEIERIWRWELASGHYPSKRSAGISFNLPQGGGGTTGTSSTVNGGLVKVENPGLPKKTEEDLRREREVRIEVERRLRDQGRAGGGVNQGNSGSGGIVVGGSSDDPLRTNGVEIVPVGPGRKYLDLPLKGGRQALPYPPRPDGRATLDLDKVMDHCDFGEGKYVRDCLEVLRVNGGMEPPLRRGIHDNWRSTFISTTNPNSISSVSELSRRKLEQEETNLTSLMNSTTSTFSDLLQTRQQLTLTTGPSASHHRHPHFVPHPSHPTADPACDPAHPRLFHIFWAGPFTDKPYSAALSFLFTQHLSLSSRIGSLESDPTLCRPQLWIWINPGPASSFPDPRAERRMRQDLAKNPWSAPLLHKRFKESVKFRLWNTTEQLDGVEEMKGWREMRLFNSGGVKYGVSKLTLTALYDDTGRGHSHASFVRFSVGWISSTSSRRNRTSKRTRRSR